MAYRATAIFLLVLYLGLASAEKPLQQTTYCLTSDECLQQSQLLSIIGVTNFSVGRFSTFGCFYYGDTAYFGLGGSIDDMSESPLFRGRTRVWCAASYDDIKVATTSSPSPGRPSIVPSWEPSPSPSVQPTYIPTKTPTFQPTMAPSFRPTFHPTKSSSEVPSLSPTPKPTALPTKKPTSQPTRQPSSKPTALPTKTPISQPTRQPSSKPTALPTKTPTSQPTRQPSSKPTALPTKTPTSQPTRQPSSKPTAFPTKKPTSQPTRQPSSKPTALPTKKPTSEPTQLELASSRDSSPTSERVCRNQKLCNRRRQELGFNKYYVGSYTTKGCFSKGQTAYFGIGGTEAQKIKMDLSGSKERVLCDFSVNPNPAPSKKPTEKPTKKPSRAPTKPPAPSPISLDSKGNYCIDVQVVTDKYGTETGFNLSTNPGDGSGSKKLVGLEVGSLESETTYARTVCVPRGNYTFTIADTFNGICCAFGRGSYSVKLDGREIVSGGRFTEKTMSIDILAGYEPAMNERDEDWLLAHNKRRKVYHEEHGREYIPLQWSAELASDASKWVDEILPTCAIIRQSHGDGENMSVKNYPGISGGNNESPEDILYRWSDRVLQLKKGYPENQTMTQVMWRASHFVGCSDKFAKMDDGSYCYVSICRYRRPGNCAPQSMGGWQAATLTDETPCGKVCPKEGCY